MTAVRLAIHTADRDHARTLAGALQDLVEPTPDALTLFEEKGEDGRTAWRIDAYYTDPPEAAALGTQLAAILDAPAPRITIEDVPALNWEIGRAHV